MKTTKTVKQMLDQINPNGRVSINYKQMSIKSALTTYSNYKVNQWFVGYGGILTLKITIKGAF